MTVAAIDAGPLIFKMAADGSELDQVHRLNYRTFVEEIPQHHRNPDRLLVDRFHDDNTYFVCKHDSRVVGMIAVRSRRPFSLDEKLPDLDSYLPARWSFCESRLLAVEPEYRNGFVFRGLVRELTSYCAGLGINASVISGAVKQLRLYEHMGFVPFGPRVGTADAPYQPMYITIDEFAARTEPSMARHSGSHRVPVSFLPGPVDVHPEVRKAYSAPAVSHRDDSFLTEINRTKALLCRLVGAPHVDILLGSGTLANDVVAMQLAALDEPGVVFSNGEFGERLFDHASRAGLRFARESFEWGEPIDAQRIDRARARHPLARWWWIVHHETSTGVLNDLTHASLVCRGDRIKLACDCISSIGVVPLDLRHVYLATAVSGKGIGAFAGLSMVFHHGNTVPSPKAPRYMDLQLYADADGVPFTQSSGLVGALRVAAEHALRREQSTDVPALATWLREQLRELGFDLVAPDDCASPGIVTLPIGPRQSALDLGDRLARAGFALSYKSKYLRERNWIQIALMGECSRHKVVMLLHALQRLRVVTERLTAYSPLASPAIVSNSSCSRD